VDSTGSVIASQRPATLCTRRPIYWSLSSSFIVM